ncbi:hypothetical protein Tco_0528300 [Tanacetum coccineum]
MDNSNVCHIPHASEKEKLDLNKSQSAQMPKEVNHMKNVPYASAVGSIMYAVQGLCFVLNGGAVDWKSSKQSTTAMSATESEYIAASEAAMEAVWIRKFISGLVEESILILIGYALYYTHAIIKDDGVYGLPLNGVSFRAKRQAKLLERKRQRKLRQKEQRLRDQLNGAKVDVYVADLDIFEATPSEADPFIPDENVFTLLDSVRLSNKTAFIVKLKVGLPMIKQAHKHREQKAAVSNGSKVWTKKHKPENGSGEFVKMRVQNDAINQTDQSNCQLMIGSISVTVRNSSGKQKVDNLAVGSKILATLPHISVLFYC